MICKCGNNIPDARIRLGYINCINCSDVQQVRSVDITYHKTGNTIQVLPKDAADDINKKSQRRGFGIMKGMQPSGSSIYNPKNIKYGASNTILGATDIVYNEIGVEMMEVYDILGFDEACKFINKKFTNDVINLRQKNNLIKSIKLCETVNKV